MEKLSESFQMAPELQEIVRAALHDVMVLRPEDPIRYLATRLRDLNMDRKIREFPAETLERFRQQFDAADADASGYIGVDEFVNVSRLTSRHLEFFVTEEVLRQRFASIDTDGSGRINFDEFVRSQVCLLYTSPSPRDRG